MAHDLVPCRPTNPTILRQHFGEFVHERWQIFHGRRRSEDVVVRAQQERLAVAMDVKPVVFPVDVDILSVRAARHVGGLDTEAVEKGLLALVEQAGCHGVTADDPPASLEELIQAVDPLAQGDAALERRASIHVG